MTAQTKQKSRDLARSLVDYEYFSPGSNMTSQQLVDKYDLAIQKLINLEVLSALEELEKKSTHYTSDGLVADGLDPWATSVNTIESIKNRYKL